MVRERSGARPGVGKGVDHLTLGAIGRLSGGGRCGNGGGRVEGRGAKRTGGEVRGNVQI